ncbi:MAG: sigma-70 family RNA polymerase sigma factor [Anaerolineales bacterium]|nr:sigma-70 family RNA polymerase sigma factor [Anaerolineales bacterium]
MTITLADFDNLVANYASEIHQYLWRMLQDPQDAEDVLQESFLRALQAYPRLAPDSNPRAWLYKIASNAARTRLKQRARYIQQNQELAPERNSTPGSSHDHLIRLAMRQAVETLPDKQRISLLLRYYQGLEFAEIGEILACSPEAARANLSQAIRKLRRMLTEE